MKSKAPPMAICSECNQYRQVHQRTDREGNKEVLCKNCYMRKYPPNRSMGICKNCMEWRTMQARGLCSSCYARAYRTGDLHNFPTTS